MNRSSCPSSRVKSYMYSTNLAKKGTNLVKSRFSWISSIKFKMSGSVLF